MNGRQEKPLTRQTLAELALTPLLGGLVEEEARLLLGDAWAESHPDGDILFSRGEPANSFFVLLDGHVQLFIEEAGRPTVLEVAKRPSVLGEAALFGDRHHPHWARVVGFARVVVIPCAPFLNALNERFDLAQLVLKSMSIRLRGLVAQISELKLKSTAQRLAGFLLGLTSKTEGSVTVRFPYDKRLAADVLGMTPESLSRALVRLAPLGVESRADNLVAVADIEGLRQFCIEETAE